jgi:hypothetical protein
MSLISIGASPGGLLRKSKGMTKMMDCGAGQAANRGDSRSYREEEQRSQAPQDAFSCSGIYETDH